MGNRRVLDTVKQSFASEQSETELELRQEQKEAYRSSNNRNLSRILDPISQMADLRDRPWSLQKSQIEDSDFNMSMKDGGKHLEEISRNSLNTSYLPRSKAGKARITNSTKSSSMPKERRSFNLNFVRYMSTIVAYFHLFWSSICNLRALDFCTKRIPDAARKFVPSTPTRHGMKTLVSESAAIWSQAFWKLLVLQALVLLKTIVRQAKSFSQAADRDYAAIVPDSPVLESRRSKYKYHVATEKTRLAEERYRSLKQQLAEAAEGLRHVDLNAVGLLTWLARQTGSGREGGGKHEKELPEHVDSNPPGRP
ncbi:hypothetical protein GUITHDRAFT_147716 [Guillardia theta CCMP2712]|uniref:Uncharacterized protein n=1 Tax=Guillardia theta (strain CCMP2712) TaxID=905079 RepID=L1IBR6_GUITC|nr:hypothetical protein GUITHDRAFT_147716 [Guillardia theta CCMP2712]EKX33696.1 hypothetical protein GUITHDRAFT_147716 [Guillardia theta CCMP2712]|eukprot:XP_005820676.1 hypothetical protein GUITHDRAFT_147716 [Guillardia theta CCMP2712]